MEGALIWFFHLIIGINFLELIKALAPVATALIAFFALRNWQRQDKAKREAEFLDALIEATYTYIVEMGKPITVLETAKIGMQSYARTWEQGNQATIAVRGAIKYIEKRGAEHEKLLGATLDALQPSVIKLRSLSVKGQIFSFRGYVKCHDAVVMLTWHFDRMQAFRAFISSTTWNWENSRVLEHLKNLMAIDADEIRQNVQENHLALLEFARETYGWVYGRPRQWDPIRRLRRLAHRWRNRNLECESPAASRS